MKFFIVDDDIEMIRAMTLALEGNGHIVKLCVAGATTIPKISSFKPDILLTDLVMAEWGGLDSDVNCAKCESVKIHGSILSL